MNRVGRVVLQELVARDVGHSPALVVDNEATGNGGEPTPTGPVEVGGLEVERHRAVMRASGGGCVFGFEGSGHGSDGNRPAQGPVREAPVEA